MNFLKKLSKVKEIRFLLSTGESSSGIRHFLNENLKNLNT